MNFANACAVGAAVICMTGAPPASAQEDFSALQRMVQQDCRAGSFSGVLVVARRGSVLFSEACGFADPVNGRPVTADTLFKIYSTSKFLTALLVMRLHERGELDIDQPLHAYVDGTPETWGGVTLRQLLNHTSGTPDLTEALVVHFDVDPGKAMAAVLAEAARSGGALEGQGTFRYNNFGFELLAEATVRAGGQPFDVQLREHVFEPAGMGAARLELASSYAGHPQPVTASDLAIGYNGTPGALVHAMNYAFIQRGAGAVHANARDFVALDLALTEGRILSCASLSEMTAHPVEQPVAAGRLPRRWGLGALIMESEGVRMHGHTGGTNGYISDFQRFPDHDAMMIILTNRGSTVTAPFRAEVARALQGARGGGQAACATPAPSCMTSPASAAEVDAAGTPRRAAGNLHAR